MTDEPKTGEALYRRARLADMLAEAAELEHSLCCQYLYAAFSLRRTVDEGLTPRQVDLVRNWQTTVMQVARQEMEHLGYVMNLQTSIGEAPHLVRPNFPLEPNYYETGVESKLTKFDLETMQRFVLFELPEAGTMTPDTVERLAAAVPFYDDTKHHTIGELYAGIEALMVELDAEGDLFIGPPGAQTRIGESAQPEQVHRNTEEGLDAYDVKIDPVFDLASAKAAIEQIVEEGEGSHGEREDSHFGKFLSIVEGLQAETTRCGTAFVPARNCVTDPRSMVPGRGNAQKEGFLITNAQTNTVSRAFDQAYTTLMLLLARFFAATDQGDNDSTALEYAAFFPFMTMVIRPLAEVLTRLPATEEAGDDRRAGPTFRFERRIKFLPHRDAGFDILASNIAMVHEAVAECAKEDFGDPWINERLSFMVENLWRINDNFKTATGARNVL